MALLLACSLLAPLAGALAPPARGKGNKASRQNFKMTETLRSLARGTRSDAGARTRVIINLPEGATAADQARTLLHGTGASVHGQLDALGVMVADVPVARLEELASHGEVSWLSEDAEVRTLSTPDNTSHMEVTTGANQVLPAGNTAQANGGAGNGVGIAVLDSGISPMDGAEFAGYQWKSGLLGLTQTLEPYDRIKKSIDFTGEGSVVDVYGHGTHTAGIAAGTGQSSEEDAAQHAGSPTYGGVATGANLISVRVLNNLGVGTVSNVIAGIDWVIKNKSTYKIGVINLSLGTPISQSYKTDPLCQAVGRAVDAGIVVVAAAGKSDHRRRDQHAAD
jgi:serine protease AprX